MNAVMCNGPLESTASSFALSNIFYFNKNWIFLYEFEFSLKSESKFQPKKITMFPYARNKERKNNFQYTHKKRRRLKAIHPTIPTVQQKIDLCNSATKI